MNHPVKKPQAAIKVMVVIAMSVFLIGCVSTSKWSTYEAESSGSKTQGEVTYYLTIKPKRRDFEVNPVFMTGSSGPPYTLRLDATTSVRGKRMKTIHIYKIQMILPDGTEYDVLQGQPVAVAPGEYDSWWVKYRSGELPLEFQEGAKVVVEVHCKAGSSDVVIRKTFVGKKGADTESIWDAYGSA